ncbi:MAG: hypothetical protein IPG74_00615 [Flavobacteriales bacterium]|nr:hypothetical protein [Flavobacteriales bacterium]
MKPNIKLSLTRLSVLALLALLRNVIAKMTGNAFFTTPAVTMVAMDGQADALEAAIEAATDGSKEARILRDVEVAKAQAMLRTQADYVRTICAGNEAMLISSGFQMATVPTPVGLPNAPLIKSVRMTGETGQVEVRWNSQRGVDSCNVFITMQNPAEGAVWVHVGTTTKSRITLNDLESYKPVWIGVRAVGAAGTSAMSDPVIGIAA